MPVAVWERHTRRGQRGQQGRLVKSVPKEESRVWWAALQENGEGMDTPRGGAAAKFVNEPSRQESLRNDELPGWRWEEPKRIWHGSKM